MSTTYGEREGKLSLAAAWEILGGLPCNGICGYIENTVTLEMNGQYGQIIEKKAENMYRTINQKIASFPASNKSDASESNDPQGNQPDTAGDRTVVGICIRMIRLYSDRRKIFRN